MFEDIINNYADQFSVPAIWISAVIQKESSGRADLITPERTGTPSYGLMQLQPSTARGLGFTGNDTDLLDPDTNIYYGTKLLAQLYRQYGPDVRRIYSAYNSGKPDLYKSSSEVALHVSQFVSILEQQTKIFFASAPTTTAVGGVAAILGVVILAYWGGH